MQLTRAATPFLGIVGAGLTLIGTFVGIADAGTQLVYWQMGTGNQVAMIALAHRFENATGATAIFMAGGISLMAGSILLALALWRSRVAPAWAAACLPVGLIGTVAAFASASRPGLVAASVAMLVGLGAIALRPGPLAVPAVASAV
jgi:hypothetical protein